MKVALIHDWLTGMRGGEKVLEQFCMMFPGADIYTLICDKKKISGTIKKHRIRTSFLQFIPGIFRFYRNLLPVFPFAIERFKLDKYSLVISSSHCAAKGIIPPDVRKHFCYCHTPMRYAWDQFDIYFSPEKTGKFRLGIINKLMPKIREWDVKSAERAGYFIANSMHVKERIMKYYGRDAEVIHPPVNTGFFTPGESVKKEEFYLIVSALTEYKKVDFAAEAFKFLPDKKLVIIGSGPGLGNLKKIAGKNVEILGRRTDEEIRDYYRRAKCLLFPGEEDFGITMGEALACGTPVLALNRGGALEIVEEGETGEFFNGTREDFIKKLEKMKDKMYDVKKLREHVLRFSEENFRKKISLFFKEKGAYE